MGVCLCFLFYLERHINSSLSNRYKGALLYGLSPVCALGETEHPGHLNVRGVLRHCVSSKGLHPLRRESGYSLNVKGVTSKSHAFYLFYCLTNTPRRPGVQVAKNL